MHWPKEAEVPMLVHRTCRDNQKGISNDNQSNNHALRS